MQSNEIQYSCSAIMSSFMMPIIIFFKVLIQFGIEVIVSGGVVLHCIKLLVAILSFLTVQLDGAKVNIFNSYTLYSGFNYRYSQNLVAVLRKLNLH